MAATSKAVYRSLTDQASCGFYRSPESQCITFSTNRPFCSAPGAFIPMGRLSGPVTRALNVAASPKNAARPDSTRITAPCSQPPAVSRRVSALNCQAFRGIRETNVPGSTNNGSAPGGARNACPVNVRTAVTDSSAWRPRTMRCDRSVVSAVAQKRSSSVWQLACASSTHTAGPFPSRQAGLTTG
jgi:hypothetical protein